MISYSCTKSEDFAIADQTNEVLRFTSQDQEILNNLFTQSRISVKKEILNFSDINAFKIFLDLTQKMKPEEFKYFSRSIEFKSFEEFADELIKDSSLSVFEIATEYPEFFDVFENSLDIKVLFRRIANENGIYALNQSLIFQNDDYQIISYFDSWVNNDVVIDLNFLNSNSDFNFRFNESVDSRTCNTTSWDEIVMYDGGDKRLRSKLWVWTTLSPIWNFPNIEGWNVIQGWSFENRSEDDNWLMGWHGEDADMYCKIDAYVSNTNEFQWVWKTCSSCNTLDHSQSTLNTYFPGSTAPSVPAIKFQPLIWFISQLTDKQDPNLLNVDNDCDGTGSGDVINEDLNPEICYNCW